jgi:hypothetical protein
MMGIASLHLSDGLVQGGGERPLEVGEARSGAFMAICEVGKALHRGRPADRPWALAIEAAERAGGVRGRRSVRK